MVSPVGSPINTASPAHPASPATPGTPQMPHNPMRPDALAELGALFEAAMVALGSPALLASPAHPLSPGGIPRDWNFDWGLDLSPNLNLNLGPDVGHAHLGQPDAGHAGFADLPNPPPLVLAEPDAGGAVQPQPDLPAADFSPDWQAILNQLIQTPPDQQIPFVLATPPNTGDSVQTPLLRSAAQFPLFVPGQGSAQSAASAATAGISSAGSRQAHATPRPRHRQLLEDFDRADVTLAGLFSPTATAADAGASGQIRRRDTDGQGPSQTRRRLEF